MAYDVETFTELGICDPMPSPFAARWDPIKDAQECDFGWIGQDHGGVYLLKHPTAALLDHPELWRAVDLFNADVRELTREDYEQLTNFDYESLQIMQAAYRRQKVTQDDG